ncbi:AhpD-like protein [Tricladium varicosporioides]|nr:AhpD-like protein [Hymenoscyphus varicosporioides]
MSDLSSAHTKLFEEGIKARRNVVGDAYVDKALEGGSSNFAKPMQELVTEFCWGSVWTRPGLSLKQRSLINIGMLCALNRGPELGNHVRGAIRNGLTPLEVREAILQVSVYCGMPAGLEGFKIAERIINDMVEKGEYKPEKEGELC